MTHSRADARSLPALPVLLIAIAASMSGPIPARGEEVQFIPHVITNYAWGAATTYATDVDGDGDVDILAAYGTAIAWFENDGGSPPSFIERDVTGGHGLLYPVAVFAADVDGDGDTDVIAAATWQTTLAWYENDGAYPPTFTRRFVSSTTALSVFAADLDADGDTDVLSGPDFHRIAWYENDGASPPTFSERAIAAGAQASSVFARDVDGDGDTDVLSASIWDDTIAWYESDGEASPTFTEHVISTTAVEARSVYATDVDGDGDIDVLSASYADNKIAWYESDGGGTGVLRPTFTERVISSTAEGATSVYAVDVDGDTDIDVLSTSASDDTVAWYESDGGSPPAFTEHVISMTADGAFSVFATDLDGDGDTDAVATETTAGRIAWYENTTPRCGDGFRGTGEACDDGFNDSCGTCNADCTGPGGGFTCGDGEVCPEFEACDDGSPRFGDGCAWNCVIEGGPHMALIPVDAHTVHAINGNEITIPSGGTTVEFEIRAFDLQGNEDTCLGAYQAQVDASGYSSGLGGTLTPAQLPCETDDDCLGKAVCVDGICSARAAAYIDATRADYLFAGEAGFFATDLSTLNYRFGASVSTCIHRDFGYCGTLFLDVPASAADTYTVGFLSNLNTYISGESKEPIEPLALTPALITITTPICGNDSTELGEECDGSDDAGCPGSCLTDCTCASCGNGTCDPIENACRCPEDCGAPPTSERFAATCDDGLDNDCDGSADCDDPDCAYDSACGAIPTVSAWGVAIMAMILMVAAKVWFRVGGVRSGCGGRRSSGLRAG